MRLHTQCREKINGYAKILNFLRCAVAGKVNAIPGIGAEPVKRMRLLLPFEIGGGRDGSLFYILTRLRVEYRYEAIDFVERNGMQQKSFRHAEDRGVGSHTQRQRASANEGCEAVLPKHA